ARSLSASGSTPGDEDLAGAEYPNGTILDDRYRIERRLGAGATATTYLATDRLVDGYVVLKVMRDRGLEARLARAEFRALRELSHPSLPRIFDIAPPDAPFHIKLEYIRGTTLRELRPDFRFKQEACRRVGLQILSALEYLAERSQIHRDVSPANIMVPDEEEG